MEGSEQGNLGRQGRKLLAVAEFQRQEAGELPDLGRQFKDASCRQP